MSQFKVVAVLWVALASVAVAEAPRFTEWSAPENVGPVVNWPGKSDMQAFVSRDGLSLYYSSGRDGSSGMDIYVSQRPSIGEAWGEPQNLGSAINGDPLVKSAEMTPVLSPDGHRLYFASNRSGGSGSWDIYVSRRQNVRDDFGWEPAENLGDTINTPLNDEPGCFFKDDATGTTTFYLTREGGPQGADIFAAVLQTDGSLGVPVPVDELNTTFNDQFPSFRRDGLEVYFASNRPGSIAGSLDVWVATRASTTEPWSEPVPLEGVNTEFIENHPRLSFDRTELYFTSTRPQTPPVAGPPQELYFTTRSPLAGGQ